MHVRGDWPAMSYLFPGTTFWTWGLRCVGRCDRRAQPPVLKRPGRYPTLEPDDPDNAAWLRRRLKRHYKLTPPETGAEAVEAAQAGHPDPAAWLRAWPSSRSGGEPGA